MNEHSRNPDMMLESPSTCEIYIMRMFYVPVYHIFIILINSVSSLKTYLNYFQQSFLLCVFIFPFTYFILVFLMHILFTKSEVSDTPMYTMVVDAGRYLLIYSYIKRI